MVRKKNKNVPTSFQNLFIKRSLITFFIITFVYRKNWSLYFLIAGVSLLSIWVHVHVRLWLAKSKDAIWCSRGTCGRTSWSAVYWATQFYTRVKYTDYVWNNKEYTLNLLWNNKEYTLSHLPFDCKKFYCSPNNRVSCFEMVIIISQAINESVEA